MLLLAAALLLFLTLLLLLAPRLHVTSQSCEETLIHQISNRVGMATSLNVLQVKKEHTIHRNQESATATSRES
jgi:hypothetical protein